MRQTPLAQANTLPNLFPQMALHSPKRPPSLVVSLQLSPGEPSPSPLSAEPEWAKALEAGALVVEGSATTATASAVICIVGAPQEVLSEAFTSTGNDDALNTGSQKGQGQAGNGNGTDDDDDDNTPLDRLSATATATTTPAARQPRQSIQPILATIPITLADPFSLDAYSLLLRRHARIGKDLLLARVTTVSAGRLFHDVYEAHAINKVLFRTQPEEGLLHRMKSRNPLNNLEIVGDVWYYRVSVLDIRRGIEDLKKKAQRESILKEKQLSCADKLAPPSATNGHRRFSLAAVATTALEAAAELVSPVIHGHGSHRRASSSYVPVETVIRTLPSPVTVEDSERSSPLGGQPKERFSPIKSAGSGGRKSPSSGMSPPSGPIIFRAEFFGTDDDFLMKAAVRAYFKEVGY